MGGRTIPLAVVDDRHAYARLPPLSVPPGEVQQIFQVTLEGGEGAAPLIVVNDAAFPDLTALAVGPPTHASRPCAKPWRTC